MSLEVYEIRRSDRLQKEIKKHLVNLKSNIDYIENDDFEHYDYNLYELECLLLDVKYFDVVLDKVVDIIDDRKGIAREAAERC